MFVLIIALPDLRCSSSHLMGFFYRTIRIVENGIKPAYVFDGKPPELKSGVVRISVPITREESTNCSCSYRNVLRNGQRRKKMAKRQRKQVRYIVFCSRGWSCL